MQHNTRQRFPRTGFASPHFQQKNFRGFGGHANRPGFSPAKRAFSAPAANAGVLKPKGPQAPNSGNNRNMPGMGQIDARDTISIKNRIKMGDARAKIMQKRMNKGKEGGVQIQQSVALAGPPGPQGFHHPGQQPFRPEIRVTIQPDPRPQGPAFPQPNMNPPQQPRPVFDQMGPRMRMSGNMPRPAFPGHQQGPVMQQQQPPLIQQRMPMNQQRPPFPQQVPSFNQQRPPLNQQRPSFNQQGPVHQQRPPIHQQRLPIQQQRPPFNQQQRLPMNPPQRLPFGQRPPQPLNQQNQQARLPFSPMQGPPQQQSFIHSPQEFNQPPQEPFQQTFCQSALEFEQQPAEFMRDQFEELPPQLEDQGQSFGVDDSLAFNCEPQFEDPNAPFDQLGPSPDQAFGQQAPLPVQIKQTPPHFMQPSNPNQPMSFDQLRPGQGFNTGPNPHQQPHPNMNQPPPSAFVEPQPAFEPGFQEEHLDLMPENQSRVENTGTSLKITRTIPEVSFDGKNLTVRRRMPATNQIEEAKKAFARIGAGMSSANFTENRHEQPVKRKFTPVPIKAPSPQRVMVKTGGPTLNSKKNETSNSFTANSAALSRNQNEASTGFSENQNETFSGFSANRNVPSAGFSGNSNSTVGFSGNTSSAGFSGNTSSVGFSGNTSSAGFTGNQYVSFNSNSGNWNVPSAGRGPVSTQANTRSVSSRSEIAPALLDVITRTVSNPLQQQQLQSSRLKPPPQMSEQRQSALTRIKLPVQQQQKASVFSRIQQAPPAPTVPVSRRGQGQSGLVLSRLSSYSAPAPVVKQSPLFPAPASTVQLARGSQSAVAASRRVAVKRPAMSLSERFSGEVTSQAIPVITDSTQAKKRCSSEPEVERAVFRNEVSMTSQAPVQSQTREEPGVTLLSPLQGFRIQVTNLSSAVTQDDLIELFGSLGPLKRANLLINGQAEVAFIHKEHAVQALKIYNNRELDNQPMFLKLLTPLNAKYMQAPDSEEDTGAPLPASYRTKIQPPAPTSAPVEIPLIHKALFKTASPAPTKAVRFTVKL